jgi:hypothetical protein
VTIQPNPYQGLKLSLGFTHLWILRDNTTESLSGIETASTSSVVPLSVTIQPNPYQGLNKQDRSCSSSIDKSLSRKTNDYLRGNTVRLSYQKVCERGWVSGAEPQPYDFIGFHSVLKRTVLS